MEGGGEYLSPLLKVNNHFVSWRQVVFDQRVGDEPVGPRSRGREFVWVQDLGGPHLLENRQPMGHPAQCNVQIPNAFATKEVVDSLHLSLQVFHGFHG